LLEVFIDVVSIWFSVVVRVSYHLVLGFLFQVINLCWDFFFGGVIYVGGLLVPDFLASMGFLPILCIYILFVVYQPTFVSLWELSTQVWVVLKAPA
jgi:hypothetical protein